MKKKGKVHPSPPPPPPPSQPPPPPPPSSSSSHYESLSVLRLLPATILVLVSVLSAEDREVLAYLITRGTATISVDSSNNNKKKTKTATKKKSNKSSRNNHKPPVFDCECFDCYTSYWLRWDSSPNRELIHDIIEAFENHHLATTGGEEYVSRNKSKRGKKKEKLSRRVDEKPVVEVVVPPVVETAEVLESHVSSPDRSSEAEVAERETQDEEEVFAVEEEEEEESRVVLPVAAGTGHRGLARKVLPDVLGLFNSSFWRLWNPNA